MPFVLVVTIIWGAITHPIEMRVTVTVPDARYSAEFKGEKGLHHRKKRRVDGVTNQ